MTADHRHELMNASSHVVHCSRGGRTSRRAPRSGPQAETCQWTTTAASRPKQPHPCANTGGQDRDRTSDLRFQGERPPLSKGSSGGTSSFVRVKLNPVDQQEVVEPLLRSLTAADRRTAPARWWRTAADQGSSVRPFGGRGWLTLPEQGRGARGAAGDESPHVAGRSARIHLQRYVLWPWFSRRAAG